MLKVTTPKSREAGGKVRIHTAKGEILDFDEVLMTTPLGWLKEHKDKAFEPALTESIQSGIEAISVGHLEKVRCILIREYYLTILS